MTPRVVLVAVGLALALGGPAQASEPMSDFDPKNVALKVNAKGEALVLYQRPDGTQRRVLVWGAINARVPDPAVPQVRFKYDYAGGWGKYRKLYWKTFKDSCGRYDGPALAYLIKACKAPDGTSWALQLWQREQPLLGFDPWLPKHTRYELHISHWSGPLANLEVSTNFTYGGGARGVFGRFMYLDKPIHGFGSTSTGNPKDRYGRNVFIDTRNSTYGLGWKRESGILLHRPTGTFCHSFVAQKPFPDYPSQAMRPAAPGDRYRFTIMGPGVTPVIQADIAGIGEEDRKRDPEFDALFDRIMAGDRICAGER